MIKTNRERCMNPFQCKGGSKNKKATKNGRICPAFVALIRIIDTVMFADVSTPSWRLNIRETS